MDRDKPVSFGTGCRFQWEASQDAYVVLYPEGMVTLSETAAAILKHVDGARTCSDIVNVLQEEYPGADLESDVTGFLEEAAARGWIHVQQERTDPNQ